MDRARSRSRAQFVPEAAILDLGLPVMDGFEVATKLKEMARR